MVGLLLGWPQHALRADCREGFALVLCAHQGNAQVARLLLTAPHHATRANCSNGKTALVMACKRGHVEMARVLLSAPLHAARADCREGDALIVAVRSACCWSGRSTRPAPAAAEAPRCAGQGGQGITRSWICCGCTS
jgi:hypothetical protein